MNRITDEPCGCLNCNWLGTVGECEPDVDGDGSLGCPRCGEVVIIYIDEIIKAAENTDEVYEQ